MRLSAREWKAPCQLEWTAAVAGTRPARPRNAAPALAELGRRLHDVIDEPDLLSHRLLPPELRPTGDDLDLGPRLVQERRGLQCGLPGADHRHPPAAELVQAVMHRAVRHEVGGQPG